MRGWQGGGVEGGRVVGDGSMGEGRPLPALHVSSTAQSTSSRDVELVAVRDQLEHLSIEVVLVDLLLSLHVADAQVLQVRVVGQTFLSLHHLGLHFRRFQLDKDSPTPFTLGGSGRLESFPRHFNHIILSVHSLRIDSSDHLFCSVHITNTDGSFWKLLHCDAERHRTFVHVTNLILKTLDAITVVSNLGFYLLELGVVVVERRAEVGQQPKYGLLEVFIIDHLVFVELFTGRVDDGRVHLDIGQGGHGEGGETGQVGRSLRGCTKSFGHSCCTSSGAGVTELSVRDFWISAGWS